jgi:hypothetical protein
MTVLQLVRLLHSRFAGEIEFDYIAFNLDMPGPQSRQTKTSIFTSINLASGSQETGGKNPQHRGHHRLFFQARLFDMRSDSRAHFRQRLGKLDQPPELPSLLPPDVICVIKRLQTTGGISPYCLHGPARGSVDPSVTPGRWDF